MGRVRDAMRRAAEADRQTTETAVPLDAPAGPIPMPADAENAFPIEASTLEPVDRPAVVDGLLEKEPVPGADDSSKSNGTPILHFSPVMSAKIVVDEAIMPASREQYRRLAASMHQAQAANGTKVVMVTSAVASEGKTLNASNLALTLSESYQRHVLLIDADLRRPSLHKVFDLPAAPGLTDGLAAVEMTPLHLHRVSETLTVLTAGKTNTDPMAGLTSPRMVRVIEEARKTFDWVIVDTPPVGLLTDASLLGAMVDGVLVVVMAGSTPHDLVQRAIDEIGGHRVLGVVLNRAILPEHKYGYGYGSGYDAYFSGNGNGAAPAPPNGQPATGPTRQ